MYQVDNAKCFTELRSHDMTTPDMIMQIIKPTKAIKPPSDIN